VAKRQVANESAALAALWAGVTHDLRQPIQAALLLADLAGRTQDRTVLATTYGHLEQQLHDIQDMVEATGALARLEAGLQVPRRNSFSLSELMDEAGAAVRDRAGLVVTVEMDGADVMIEGDRALLVTAFSGLLRQALSKQEGAALGVSGKRTGSQLDVSLNYLGAPFGARERTAFFISQCGKARERVALGFAYLERLLAVMGFDLSAGSGSQNRPQLVVSTAKSPPTKKKRTGVS
jgi:two-component system, sensor histidine kinase